MCRVKVADINLGEDHNCEPEASDFLGTLLRDATSSHLLETLVTKSSPQIFNLLWATYFHQKLSRLSVHPVANFVVARALSRIDEVQLGSAYEELGKSWQKIISRGPKQVLVERGLTSTPTESSRVGVVKALVDRAVILGSHEGDLVEVCHSTIALHIVLS